MQQSAPSEKQKSYLQMRRLAFFRCISSRVYTAAVQDMDRREDNYIAYYSFCDLGEYKKISHLLILTKAFLFTSSLGATWKVG